MVRHFKSLVHIYMYTADKYMRTWACTSHTNTHTCMHTHTHALIHIFLHLSKHFQTTQNDTTPNKITSRPIRILTAHPLGNSEDEVGGGYGQLVIMMSPCVKLTVNSPVILHPVWLA